MGSYQCPKKTNPNFIIMGSFTELTVCLKIVKSHGDLYGSHVKPNAQNLV